MSNLLLITDIPRLRKIFSRFSDEKGIKLRIVNNLEKGGEEIVADKPAMVFVQTHLSGFSADILLMHLKKQLGRKRTRFVLLSPPDQVSDETKKLYQGQLDTSLSDNDLFDAIGEIIVDLVPKGKKTVHPAAEMHITVPPQSEVASKGDQASHLTHHKTPEQTPDTPVMPEVTALTTLNYATEPIEPSLEEQGVTYAPRTRVSVYSEFTSSFDNAVSNILPDEEIDEQLKEHPHSWDHEAIENIEPAPSRSKKTTIILWLAALLIAAVVVTMLQHSISTSKPVDIATQKANSQPQEPAKPAVTPSPVTSGTKQDSATVAAATPNTPTVVTGPQPGTKPSTTGAEAQLSDKAMLLAIAENRGQKDQSKGVPASPRLTALPDFIPRAGLDKAYSAANPGWERYKGNVTEFKIYRENSSIKAIQVIDRGGQGVPESFMKAVLRQISSKPVFVMESSEKKDGYEIQRGQVAENLKVVYYRDEKGGRLRAFVTTWK